MNLRSSGKNSGAGISSTLLVLTLFAAALTAGCGAGSAPPGFGDVHSDIAIGATGDGTGSLAIDYDASDPIEVFRNTCIGGTGDACDGGIVLYSSESPGFDALFEAEPEHGLFPLVEGTPVSLELTANDAGASIFLNGTSLTEPGDSVAIGAAPEGLHIHGEWQLTLPGGASPAGEYFIGFKLTTTSVRYTESAPFGVTLAVGESLS